MDSKIDRSLATNKRIMHNMEDFRVATDLYLFDYSDSDNGTMSIIHLIRRK